MWTGQGCSRLISTLFAVLIRMLDLDFVYARTADPAEESPSDWMGSADNIDQHAKAKEVGRALEPYLVADIPTASFRIANPLAEGTASIAVFHLGSRTESVFSSLAPGDQSFRPRPNVCCSRLRSIRQRWRCRRRDT